MSTPDVFMIVSRTRELFEANFVKSRPGVKTANCQLPAWVICPSSYSVRYAIGALMTSGINANFWTLEGKESPWDWACCAVRRSRVQAYHKSCRHVRMLFEFSSTGSRKELSVCTLVLCVTWKCPLFVFEEMVREPTDCNYSQWRGENMIACSGSPCNQTGNFQGMPCVYGLLIISHALPANNDCIAPHLCFRCTRFDP